MTHRLKLTLEYCNAVYYGDKTFEIRNNDRGFQKGDTVFFRPVDAKGFDTVHPVSSKRYTITYVLPYFGLKDGYVAFGIKEINSKDEIKEFTDDE